MHRRAESPLKLMLSAYAPYHSTDAQGCHSDGYNTLIERHHNYVMLCRKADDIIENFRMSTKTNAISIGISVSGWTVFKKAYGYKDVENRLLATHKMKCPIASLSKLFAAHAWMKKMEFQTNWMNKNIHDFIGNFPETLYITFGKPCAEMSNCAHIEWKVKDNYPIRAFSTMSHSLGITHYTTKEQQVVYKHYSSCTQAFEDTPHKWQYFNHYPGMVQKSRETGLTTLMHNYSSFSIDLVGVMLERLQPLNFWSFSKLLMLEMDLRNTLYLDEQDIHFNMSPGYSTAGTDLLAGPGDLVTRQIESKCWHKLPSEGAASTVTNLLRFGNLYAVMFKHKAIYERGRVKREVGPLQTKTVHDMFSLFSGTIDGDRSKGFGLGWELHEEKERDMNAQGRGELSRLRAHHSGKAQGGTSYLVLQFNHLKERHLDRYHPAAQFQPDQHRHVVCKLPLGAETPLALRPNFSPERQREFRRWVLHRPDQLDALLAEKRAELKRRRDAKVASSKRKLELALAQRQAEHLKAAEEILEPFRQEMEDALERHRLERERLVDERPNMMELGVDEERRTIMLERDDRFRYMKQRQAHEIQVLRDNLELRERLEMKIAAERTEQSRAELSAEQNAQNAQIDAEFERHHQLIREHFHLPHHAMALLRRTQEEDAISWEQREAEDRALDDEEEALREWKVREDENDEYERKWMLEHPEPEPEPEPEADEPEEMGGRRDRFELRNVSMLEDRARIPPHQDRGQRGVGKTVVVAAISNQAGVNLDQLGNDLADLFSEHYFDL